MKFECRKSCPFIGLSHRQRNRNGLVILLLVLPATAQTLNIKYEVWQEKSGNHLSAPLLGEHQERTTVPNVNGSSKKFLIKRKFSTNTFIENSERYLRTSLRATQGLYKYQKILSSLSNQDLLNYDKKWSWFSESKTVLKLGPFSFGRVCLCLSRSLRISPSVSSISVSVTGSAKVGKLHSPST